MVVVVVDDDEVGAAVDDEVGVAVDEDVDVAVDEAEVGAAMATGTD